MPAVFAKDELQELQVQVLPLLGDYIVIYDQAQALARAMALIPGFKGVVVPWSNHTMFSSHYQSMDARVLNFQNGK